MQYLENTRHVLVIIEVHNFSKSSKVKGKVHPCTGTETLYRPYGPQEE